jgi:hypothetical protein
VAHNERGAIVVLFAVTLPAILLFASFVIDAGNWWEHKRHLQMQADAAALAGAGRITIPCNSALVQAEILKYSGVGGSQYNAQIGGTGAERLHMAVGSRTYPQQSSPVDATIVEGDPCETAMVDVKLTETDVPWLLGMAPALGIDEPAFINAHARVTILKVDTLKGLTPIGVPDVNPRRAKVQFINEDNPLGPVLGQADMERLGTFNGYSRWVVPASSAIPVTVAKGVRNIGVRVVLSGSTSLTCGAPLVECYDAGSTALLPKGLLHVNGWSAEASGDAPILRKVGLPADSCGKAYFTYSATACATGLTADVDFGGSVAAVGSIVTAVAGGKDYVTTFNATTGRWELPGGSLIPVPSGAGPVPIELKWEQTKGKRSPSGPNCTTRNNNPCKGSFGIVQRAFAGTDARSGPIRIAEISQNGLPLSEYSLRQCSTGEAASACTYNLTVDVGLLGALSNAQTEDAPLVALRLTGSSQTSLDCDSTKSTLREELATGCGDSYTINTGSACPATASTLRATPQPWACVPIQTGASVGQVTDGMNERILGQTRPTSCTAPNRWHDDFPALNPDDPRITPVFLTPYGSFSGSGSGTVPVSNFATFYVTGWIGSANNANPCTGAGDEVEGAGEPGFIYGRFIKYVVTGGEGTGTTRCDFDGFGACTAVLTD